MEKALFITEKPSVAMEFVKLLNIKETKKDGFIESDKAIFTWCVGHMVTMSYPEAYDEKFKVWSLKTIPFLPEKFKYEIIPSVLKQFNVVRSLMLREDVKTIYVCTDSGREGEYIYRLVDMMVGVEGKEKKRVWIDSQTEEEIKRGIKEAKSLNEYNSLSDSAYLRAKEDYLLGINFSRLLTLIYGKTVSNIIGEDRVVIAVGRVMSCVLGMIVERELQIRNFEKTPFYKINSSIFIEEGLGYEGEWKAIEKSQYFESPKLYNDGGFKKREDAEKLINKLKEESKDNTAVIEKITKKKEVKNPPLLFNLAELQNECSKNFKISPDETLNIIQELYEKKMLTYPRTDARVLSTAIAKEITKTIKKLIRFKEDEKVPAICNNILQQQLYKDIIKSKYVDDKKITDHYAIIPTGEGLENYKNLKPLNRDIYDLVVRRFLAIFYPAAIFSKLTVETKIGAEYFFTTEKVCVNRGYLDVLEINSKEEKAKNIDFINKLKKGTIVNINDISIKEGKTSPPKRYTSGSIIIAMENAGKLIEDDELREQIKGSGIGTSATRAEILKKLERIEYIKVNSKTQIITSTTKGEVIYRVIRSSMPSLLNPRLTASWEKGLSMVVDREITPDEFMIKLEDYVKKNISNVVDNNRVINTKYLISGIEEKKKAKLDEDKINDILGVCPLCKEGTIVKNNKGYGCNNWKAGCKFFVSEICGVTIPVKEIQNLMNHGKTNIINGFKSKKGNEFSARLVLKDDKIQLSFD
ncbi:type IA DNA topoisomerase [Clostridium botulinum]|uniref:type IA DNA topoisomerase n=1 Tax=Clostridium botulinum TaxID=1491 RepID=UPI0004D53035|nr:type IA DNA topoisomerase [Clostridium botulinum]KEH98206.1 DNA topoisomerase III [Clostridium botulinum D str. 16868]